MFGYWFTPLNDIDRASVLAALLVLRKKGPGLSRSYADMIRDSRYSSIKELRVQSQGDPVRAFFTFNPTRTGIVLRAGNKADDEKRFYHEMFAVTDREFTSWLNKSREKE